MLAMCCQSEKPRFCTAWESVVVARDDRLTSAQPTAFPIGAEVGVLVVALILSRQRPDVFHCAADKVPGVHSALLLKFQWRFTQAQQDGFGSLTIDCSELFLQRTSVYPLVRSRKPTNEQVLFNGVVSKPTLTAFRRSVVS